MLFFISLHSRRIEFVACTANPTVAWVAQQARNLLMAIDDRGQPLRFLTPATTVNRHRPHRALALRPPSRQTEARHRSQRHPIRGSSAPLCSAASSTNTITRPDRKSISGLPTSRAIRHRLSSIRLTLGSRARGYQIRRVDVNPARFTCPAARSRSRLIDPRLADKPNAPDRVDELLNPQRPTEFLNPTRSPALASRRLTGARRFGRVFPVAARLEDWIPGLRRARNQDAARAGESPSATADCTRRSEPKLNEARLPSEASPAKVAKDGQHDNDDDDDPKPARHVILSLGAGRLYGDPTRFCNPHDLCGERHGSRWGELSPSRM